MKLKIFSYLGNLNWRAMKTSGDKKKKGAFWKITQTNGPSLVARFALTFSKTRSPLFQCIKSATFIVQTKRLLVELIFGKKLGNIRWVIALRP